MEPSQLSGGRLKSSNQAAFIAMIVGGEEDKPISCCGWSCFRSSGWQGLFAVWRYRGSKLRPPESFLCYTIPGADAVFATNDNELPASARVGS